MRGGTQLDKRREGFLVWLLWALTQSRLSETQFFHLVSPPGDMRTTRHPRRRWSRTQTFTSA